ncbi:CRTAC1 family protein [bacterium]|nr:CRTAC1 family protein [bacterium]
MSDKTKAFLRHARLGLWALVFWSILLGPARAAELPFEDVTDSVGLGQWRSYEYGHGAAWGDVDGDGRPDLYIGAFASYPVYHTDDPPLPNMLFLNKESGFVNAPERSVRLDGRYANTTGALFADLDNDGDLDLLVSNFTLSNSLMGQPGHRREARGGGPCMLFENIGDGRFAEVTPLPQWPINLSARNVTVIDLDNDGLLDIVFVDGHYRRWKDVDLVILRNQGHLEFEDISNTIDVPHGSLRGLGLAVGDLNEDGQFDLFVAHSNRLLLRTAAGGFADWQQGEFPAATWKSRGDDWPCGAAFGDLNGDGLLDLVYTIHGVPGRLYVFLNETTDPRQPKLVDRTKEVGLDRFFPSTKIATVELRDMDHDGRLDIVPGVLFAGRRGKLQPLVCRNLGIKNGAPQFSLPPTEEMTVYAAAGPLTDYDRDGRLDVMLVSWIKDHGFHLFRNVAKVGHWLAVRVRGDGKTGNTMGIGSIVRAYRAGHPGEPEHLIARWDMAIGFGYASGQEAIAHLGLGKEQTCDVVVAWGGQTNVVTAVKADSTVEVRFPPE